jgi:orotate phosphoribosyltransferase
MSNSKIPKMLLDIKAVHLTDTQNLFTWVSGIKSPIYCDNRLTISYPEVRTAIADGFVNIIKDKFPEAELIAGTATAGIPHAAWVSDKLNLPMVYVRSAAKDHGRSKQIEGVLEKGTKVVVIEDLLSTGGSSMQAVKALQEAGADVIGLAAIFTYGFSQVAALFNGENIPYYTLTNYDDLLSVAVENDYIKGDELELLRKWKDSPKMFMEIV